MVPVIQLQEGSPTFDKVSGGNNSDKDWKNANSLFKRRSQCRRVVGSESPYYWVAADLHKVATCQYPKGDRLVEGQPLLEILLFLKNPSVLQ